MLVTASFVPIPPLLVPVIAGGAAADDESLRSACAAAVARLLAAGPDEIVVVGLGDTSGTVGGSWDWRGFGVPEPSTAPRQKLPHALAVGAWLLDTYAGSAPTRRFHAISAELPAPECARVGDALVTGGRRIGLLVCGDGSARRSEKAPGYFDPAAAPWDEAALAALRAADTGGLLALDETVGRRLLAAGRAPWQVLAGAAAGGGFEATVDWAEAPYGVMYIVGSWTRREDGHR